MTMSETQFTDAEFLSRLTTAVLDLRTKVAAAMTVSAKEVGFTCPIGAGLALEVGRPERVEGVAERMQPFAISSREGPPLVAGFIDDTTSDAGSWLVFKSLRGLDWRDMVWAFSAAPRS